MNKIVIPIVVCKNCKGMWNPRTKKPKKCPYCQTRNWSNQKEKKGKSYRWKKLINKDGTPVKGEKK